MDKICRLGGAPLDELLEEASTSPAGSNNSECSTSKYQPTRSYLIIQTAQTLLYNIVSPREMLTLQNIVYIKLHPRTR